MMSHHALSPWPSKHRRGLDAIAACLIAMADKVAAHHAMLGPPLQQQPRRQHKQYITSELSLAAQKAVALAVRHCSTGTVGHIISNHHS